LWLIPGACVAAAIALSLALEQVDRQLSAERSSWFLFGGGPDGARELFSAVATSMLSFAGLVFSITVLVLQLASNQFSPRSLRTFLGDQRSKLAMGIFAGTYVYALLGLRLVRGATEAHEPFVPALSAWLTVPLALASVAGFIAYLQHIAQSIRAVVVIGRIADETRAAIEKLYPEQVGDEAGAAPGVLESLAAPVTQHRAKHFGRVVAVDEDQLMELAARSGLSIRFLFEVGDFVPQGAPVFEVWGAAATLDTDELLDCLTLGRERTLLQDARFGFRQLVDVAGRALSPSTNDPSTAVEVLDQLHELLRRLAARRFPDPVRGVEAGVVLVLPRPSWSDYLGLALDEVQHWGRDSLQLRAALDDLLQVAPPSGRAAVRRQLQRLGPVDDERGP
jgi:uncharacterized membrane protein